MPIIEVTPKLPTYQAIRFTMEDFASLENIFPRFTKTITNSSDGLSRVVKIEGQVYVEGETDPHDFSLVVPEGDYIVWKTTDPIMETLQHYTQRDFEEQFTQGVQYSILD